MKFGGTKNPIISEPVETQEILTIREKTEHAEAVTEFAKIGAIDERDQKLIRDLLMPRINTDRVAELAYDELLKRLEEQIERICSEKRLIVNAQEQKSLARTFADDMVGVGPLEPLLQDDKITDIMVNGPKKIYVERAGKVVLTTEQFRDDNHVLRVAQKIARDVGRRIDETSPMVDARLPDGSRVNIVLPPLAVDGASISIRRFPNRTIYLDTMSRQGNIDDRMAQFLGLCSTARMNIVVSGGTGSGKTTMLNALSYHINDDERVVTIEDSCELRLQQPHIVRLETRPANVETVRAITQRDLVKNALRMRPDRIIMGEVREGEAFDMLQAMNTGHEGSMSTLHANNPRDALMRIENMVLMAGFELPVKAIRTNIASALDLIVQIERMRDGVRRVTKVTEVIGMEGDIIATQDIFQFEHSEANDTNHVHGAFRCLNTRPRIIEKMRRFGLAEKIEDIFRGA